MFFFFLPIEVVLLVFRWAPGAASMNSIASPSRRWTQLSGFQDHAIVESDKFRQCKFDLRNAWFHYVSLLRLQVLSVVSTQYKSVLDAIRANSKTFLFVDEDAEWNFEKTGRGAERELRGAERDQSRTEWIESRSCVL